MRARYYNVDIKRFMNQDVLTGTLERISSLNRYAYVEGNPVSYLDPFGLERSIYDDWHEVLVLLEECSTSISILTDILHKIPAVSITMGSINIWTYCFDFGLGIGMAWEGVFENNFNKIDKAYDIMVDSLQGLSMTVSSLVTGGWLDSSVIDLITDIAGNLNNIQNYLSTRKVSIWSLLF